MNTIITLTDAAVEHIKAMVDKESQAKGFRLSLKKTGCSGMAYVPSIINDINEKDFHFVAQQELHVYVDREHEPFLQGVVVDYVADNTVGLKQKRLVFINPNEKNRCGCGESFTTE
jgi:iron-sulfur cluster assembly accessory protein